MPWPTLSIFPKTAKRLKSALYAKPIEDPSKPHIRVGLIGGDIPVFPPLAMLLCTGLAMLGWKVSEQPMRYLPASLGRSKEGRASIASIGFALAIRMVGKCKKALKDVGTSPDFQPVSKVADTGPFAVSRNMMYISLVSVPVSISIAFDTAWFLGTAFAMAVYLDRVVVPAEERFLEKQIGEEYLKYCKRVPRWFKFF